MRKPLRSLQTADVVTLSANPAAVWRFNRAVLLLHPLSVSQGQFRDVTSAGGCHRTVAPRRSRVKAEMDEAPDNPRNADEPSIVSAESKTVLRTTARTFSSSNQS